MNAQLLTGLIAAFGLIANLAGVGGAAAQDGHMQHGEDAHHHAAFESDRFHVRVDGVEGGRDIILIHGNASSPEVWQGTVDHLGAGWRVHRIHIQGYAGAPAGANAQGPVAAPVAEELARYIREAGLNKPVVVGHSMGGTIGLMLAARHPEAVGRLLVIDMLPYLGPAFAGPTATPEQVAAVADQVQARIADATPEAYAASTTQTITGMIKTAEKRAGPIADGLASDPKVSGHAMRELLVTDLRPELPRITAPTEVVYVAFEMPGMTPQITDAIYQGSFATLPGIKLKRIDDAAHFVFLDQPDAFYRALDAFVAE